MSAPAARALVAALPALAFALALGAVPASARPKPKPAPAPTHDDPDTEVAKRFFKQGMERYGAGEYEKALALFEKAKLAKPLPAFDFNIALCYDRLARWAEALAAYERYVVTASNPADLKEAEARIPVLRERLKASTHRAIGEEHYKKAVAHYNGGSFLAAAEEFKQAYQATPDALYLYSIAQSYRLAGDAPNAIRYYQDFLQAAPDSPQRAAVEVRLKELKAAPAGAAAAAARPGTVTASERTRAVAEVIKGKRAGFRACFDAWSAKHPGLGGQVSLSFFLDPDGVVSQVQAETRGFNAPDVSACIAKHAGTLVYPAAPNGKHTRFTYPFDFKP